jgi:hypothetical protein
MKRKPSEARDPTMSGHSERVARLTVNLALAVNETDTGHFREVRFFRGGRRRRDAIGIRIVGRGCAHAARGLDGHVRGHAARERPVYVLRVRPDGVAWSGFRA